VRDYIAEGIEIEKQERLMVAEQKVDYPAKKESNEAAN